MQTLSILPRRPRECARPLSGTHQWTRSVLCRTASCPWYGRGKGTRQRWGPVPHEHAGPGKLVLDKPIRTRYSTLNSQIITVDECAGWCFATMNSLAALSEPRAVFNYEMAHGALRCIEEVRMPTTLAYPEAPPERGRGARVDGELKVIGQDRKSTRLNSSHLGISYAVFCLNK